MKVYVERSEFSRAVSHAASIAKALKDAPLVVLEARAGVLSISGSDTEISVEHILNANIEEPGRLVVEATAAASSASKLPESTVYVSRGPRETVSLSSGRSKFSLPGPGSGQETFPFPPSPETGGLTISPAKLVAAIEAVQYAASTDDNRFGLNGIHMEYQDGALFFVATDGHRLARAGCDAVAETGDPAELPMHSLLPVRAASVICALLGKAKDYVSLRFYGRTLYLSTPALRLAFRLIEGQFPDYRAIVPDRNLLRTKVTVDRTALIGAVGRAASVVSKADQSVVPTRMAFKDSGVEMLTESRVTSAKCEDWIAAESLELIPSKNDGTAADVIGMNMDYMGDLSRSVNVESITLAFASELSPVLFESAGDPTWYAIVMPMRLG